MAWDQWQENPLQTNLQSMYKEINALKQTLMSSDRVYKRTLRIMHGFAIDTLKQSSTNGSFFNDVPWELVNIMASYVGDHFQFLFESAKQSANRIMQHIATNDEALISEDNEWRDEYKHDPNYIQLYGFGYVNIEEHCCCGALPLTLCLPCCCCLSPWPCVIISLYVNANQYCILQGIDWCCWRVFGIYNF